MRFEYLLVFVILSAMSSCTTKRKLISEIRTLKAEMKHLREERDMYLMKVKDHSDSRDETITNFLREIGDLKDQIKKLEEIEFDSDRVESNARFQKEQYKRLEEWSKALVKGYGPGIWTFGDPNLTRPLFDRKPVDPTVKGIVEEINAVKGIYGPNTILRKIENGIVYLGVDEDQKLTDQMGSFGANAFLQSVTYSLWSLEDVKCVDWNFEEGSHASPGRFCK